MTVYELIQELTHYNADYSVYVCDKNNNFARIVAVVNIYGKRIHIEIDQSVGEADEDK